MIKQRLDFQTIEKQIDPDTGFVVLEAYYLNGNLHRMNGPAQITKIEDNGYVLEEWFLHGNLHRANGEPARIVRFEGSKDPSFLEYFEFGEKIALPGPKVS